MISCGDAPNLCHVDEMVGYVDDVPVAPPVRPAGEYDVTATIVAVTKRLMYTFRRFVESDDVAQTLWVYYLENRHELDRYADSNILRARLRRAGSAYCQRELAYRLGVDVGHQHDYGKGEVRALVEFYLAGGVQGTESQGMLAGCVDTERGLRALERGDREVLVHAYGPHDREALTSAQRAAGDRALRRLCNLMNEPQGARE